jgi:small subunit ribosomal protein S13
MVECVLCTYKVVGSIPTISNFVFMVYILRTHLKKKYLIQALRDVYGLGNSLSLQLCRSLGFQRHFLLKDVTDEDIYYIDQLMEDLKLAIKGDLQRVIKQRIDELASTKSYRGLRHRQGLPLRGQRTHTNARTAKKLRKIRK